MKPTIFIHTNHMQIIGAKIAAYSLKSRSKYPDKFNVEILALENIPYLNKREGETYLRKGNEAVWRNNDLQSFSPLRMMVPQVMGFKGLALVIDPDVFAVGDVNDLLEMNMQDKSIFCRHIKEGYKSNGNGFYATSVMLLDCEKLAHWDWNRQIDEMFDKKLDYGDWISLKFENSSLIGELDEEWNHFDTLNKNTKLLHNTERSTQPWKTGLPVDFNLTIKNNWITNLTSIFKKELKYLSHPDSNQELFIINLIKECLDNGIFDEHFLRYEISQSHVRKDIFNLLERN